MFLVQILFDYIEKRNLLFSLDERLNVSKLEWRFVLFQWKRELSFRFKH